jgi:hypothetical protein
VPATRLLSCSDVSLQGQVQPQGKQLHSTSEDISLNVDSINDEYCALVNNSA